jgi:signal peptidase I
MSNYQNKPPLPVRIMRALVDLVCWTRYQVEGDSMVPTLASKHYILATKHGFSWNGPRRGDIVVFRHPVMAGHFYIKRVIGLPNEEIRLESGRVWVNGCPLEESYPSRDRFQTRPYHLKGYNGQWWLGPDEYFVMSDNRHEGRDDSRAFGPINKRLIIGRVWFRYWPPGVWGPIS